MIKRDIWDKEFPATKLPTKEKLKKQIERYGGPVRIYLGRIKTREEFEKDKKRVLDEFIGRKSDKKLKIVRIDTNIL